MEGDDIKARISKAPKYVLIPVIVVIVVIMLAIVRIAATRHASSPPPKPVTLAKPHLSTSLPTKPAGAVAAAPTANAQQTATLATTAPVASAAAAVLTPPKGVKPGYAVMDTQALDQFSHWAQVSTGVVRATSLSFTTPHGQSSNPQGPNLRYVWSSWIRTDGPTSVAEVSLVGGSVIAKATIDGQPLGNALLHYQGDPGAQQFASIALAAGWHEVKVTLGNSPYYLGQTGTVTVALGNGTAPPVAPVPYSMPAAVSPGASTLAPITKDGGASP